MMKQLIAAAVLLSISYMNSPAKVLYNVSFPKAAAHYITMEMIIPVKDPGEVVFKMPVWTPGSYKVREFSQNVDDFQAVFNENPVSVVRRDKNSWTVKTDAAGKLTVKYEVYAFDLGVRTSYVDLQKAFVHGVSAFMYAETYEFHEIELTIQPRLDWKNVCVSLPQTAKHTFSCTNYDLLADSPIATGNFEITEYTSGGTPHRVVMIGKGNYDLTKIRKDFKAISDAEVAIFGADHPSPQYIHFIQNVDNGGGGLEHLNCQTSQVNRWVYSDEKKYRSFLGLIAHEYFHLWNVKRIRPVELGPFDYDKENYTDMLWMAEGITSYYDDLTLLRCGFHDEDSYLNVLSTAINRLENKPGKKVMSLAQASRLAWVKAYLPNENSENVTISYYNKGLLVAWMLDVEIMQITNGKKRLDDVMKKLYQLSRSEDKGFTMEEFIDVCNDVCGKKMNSFFQSYIYSTDNLPYQSIASVVGLNIENQNKEVKADVGMKCNNQNGRCVVTNVRSNSPVIDAGLSVGDEILAIDGWRVKSDMSDEISRLQPEKEVEVLFVRDGEILTTRIIPVVDGTYDYKLTAKEDLSETFHDMWLSTNLK